MDLDKQLNNHKLKIFTESGIREALIRYAETSWCYGKNPALKMDILQIRMFHAYRYHSEAFTETRELKWQSIPHSNKHKETFLTNPTQHSIWDPKISPPNGDFVNAEVAFEVPHTATISNCEHCQHSGFIPCRLCSTPLPSGSNIGVSGSSSSAGATVSSNVPRQKCPRCNGTGFITEHIGQGQHKQHKCFQCAGNCSVCLGEGQLPCRKCFGSGLLKSFQQLEIKWKNLSEWTNIMKTENPQGLQSKHLKGVTGELIVNETEGFNFNRNVNQLESFPDSDVRTASVKTFDRLMSMSNAMSNMRILKVRQSVVTILVAEVDALWDQCIETFYVYGNERKVHFPNGYPHNFLKCFKFPFNLF